jgi:hypothetical protein
MDSTNQNIQCPTIKAMTVDKVKYETLQIPEDRQAGRQTDRQTDRQMDRQTYGRTDGQTDSLAEKDGDRQCQFEANQTLANKLLTLNQMACCHGASLDIEMSRVYTVCSLIRLRWLGSGACSNEFYETHKTIWHPCRHPSTADPTPQEFMKHT